MSDSEFEGEQKEVELVQDLSARGCRRGQKTNIRFLKFGTKIEKRFFLGFSFKDFGWMKREDKLLIGCF